MTSPPAGHRRKISGNSPPEKHSGVNPVLKIPLPDIQKRDSVIRPWKMIVKVNVENKSSGAIQVLISPEDSVEDLIKEALVTYEREKRRPFLKNTHSDCYNLHYSPFNLQSLKREEKLMKLGSRNFFLCSKLPNSNSSCSEKENVPIDHYAFPWMMFVHLLL